MARPKSLIKINSGECSVVNCGKHAWARTWCRMHYARMHKRGSLDLPPIKSNSERFNELFARAGDDECWLWRGGRNAAGYGQFYENGVHIPKMAHRISFMYFRGHVPRGLCVCHKCDNPPCVNPSHLFLGTNLDNARDSIKKGRNQHGDSHCHAKLTSAAVRRIRAEYKPRINSQSMLARQYGCTQTAIFCVLNGKTWSHVV